MDTEKEQPKGPLCVSITVEPENNPECATMNMLDQVMGHNEDDECYMRIARWFFDKYGKAE